MAEELEFSVCSQGRAGKIKTKQEMSNFAGWGGLAMDFSHVEAWEQL